MFLTRVLESLAIFTLLACGVAAAIMGVLLWKSQPALRFLQCCGTIGLVGGFIHGILRRPSPLAAAVEADKQLGWNELLSTAWLMRQSYADPSTPWISSLLAQADLASQHASTSSVRFRRLSGRVWGAAALSIVGVFAVAMLGPAPAASNPRDRSSQASIGRGHSPEQSSRTDAPLGAENRPILLPDPDDLHASTFGQNAMPPTATPSVTAENSGSPQNGDRRTSSAANEGTGAGAARTHEAAAAAVLTPPRIAGPSRANSTGAEAGGAGAASAHAPAGAGSTGVAAASSPPVENPPWKSSAWPAAVDHARADLAGGRVPAPYADLVRGYFSPDRGSETMVR